MATHLKIGAYLRDDELMMHNVNKCHAVAGTTARCALYNECTNPNPATNLIPVHNLQ